MEPRAFALNPYAAAYIPLSKRESNVGDGEFLHAQDPTHFAQSQQHHVSVDQREKSYPSSESLMPNKSSDATYKQMSDEDLEMDMDMEFLMMTFPGLSHESIANVYLANDGDVEATMDMLTLLETHSPETENLPDTLDIGDVSETGPSTSNPSKPKNAAMEAAAAASSSSGTYDAPPVAS
ncbi:PREDICTED: polyadenylate-binding protein-interacting protein 5 [Tarenaya hassleriana]|uniref:polyadenylate-binding protein-interacting protein 5 n=1 Tax=Tarenaya hassleriana TaxID=28532 RepID=UPI00053C3976|nr:PREDICTED: polyadenylate-binding protein-interacting protein 5 [Tarenaya hassleriana]